MEQNAGQTIITEDVEIVGTIKANAGLRIDGKLSGDVNCTGDVVIGKAANIKGNLSVSSVTIEGQVSGNIMAKDRIALKAAARVMGDVKAKRLTVEDGVSFVGKAEVNPGQGRAAAAAAEVPAEAPAADDGDDEKKAGLFGKK